MILLPILLYQYEEVIIQLFYYCKTFAMAYITGTTAILVHFQINALKSINIKTPLKWQDYLLETNYFAHGLAAISVLIFLKYSEISDLDILECFSLN
ncbi:MAG: hypothetical protein K9I36_07320 [Bacteroidia bacterium]|nr:hypothetical protein [Bacteroidia bacterium]MCF8426525.1 hypothetical protein [Bacteroidia bacterium]